jgi:hypothetical protein
LELLQLKTNHRISLCKVGNKSLRHFLFFNFFCERSLDNDIWIVISIALRTGYKTDMSKFPDDSFFIFYDKNSFFHVIKSLRHV